MTSTLVVAALAIGLVGVCYEFCAPGSIWPGALGGFVAAVALYGLVTGRFELDRTAAAIIAIPATATIVLLVGTAVRGERNKAFEGDESYRDEIGVALTPVDKHGKVRVRNREWDARSTVPLAAGAQIVVREKRGLILDVAPR